MYKLKEIHRDVPMIGECLVVFDSEKTEREDYRNVSFRLGEWDPAATDEQLEAQAREQLEPKIQPEV